MKLGFELSGLEDRCTGDRFYEATILQNAINQAFEITSKMNHFTFKKSSCDDEILRKTRYLKLS